MNRFSAILSVLIAILSFVPVASWAGEVTSDVNKTTWQDIFSDVVGKYPIPQADDMSGDTAKKTGRLNIPKNWEFTFGTQRFVASHTSYEFGTDLPPFTKPLSRLEFPINTWWLNFDLRRTCPRWSVGARAGLSVNRNSNNWMKDSDWGNSGGENYLTNYSQSYCDVREAYQFSGDVDVNVSDWLRLPANLEIRPLFTFRYQHFSLMAHDGVQWNYDAGNSESMPGNAISFRQDWWLYMIGARGSYSIDINRNLTVKLKGEADWGPALGYNIDHHIQREGKRLTLENTMGNALYFMTGLDMVIAKTVTIGVGVDYTWISTTGTHWFYNAPEGTDLRWTDGVKVWSDQLALIARVSYAF